jgi:hypothetical protein
MRVTKGTLVMMKGEKTFKNVYKLTGETIKGGVPSKAKGKDEPLVISPQRKDNHGCKKVKFVENVTDMVVKPSSSIA